MEKFSAIISKAWEVLYVKPKNWLCELPTGKVLHFTVSMILMMFFFYLVNNMWTAVCISMLVGIAKEVVVDRAIMKGTADAADVWADAFGVCVGILLIGLFAFLQCLH